MKFPVNYIASLLIYVLEYDMDSLARMASTMDSLYLCPESSISAKTAVSCTTQLAVEIASGHLSNGFAFVRPPGHHAEPDSPMGFCLYNNVGVAVKELQRRSLAQKVLILDWDVHHGNGTQKIFAQDPNVLFISLHRHDEGSFYPLGPEGSPEYIGIGAGEGKSVNIGWNGPGVTDADYMEAFFKVVMPMALEFRPDFVMVSAGFDAAAGDPIGACRVTPRGFAFMTQQLLTLADGRLLLVLEGGYNVPVIAACAEYCLRALMGEVVPEGDEVRTWHQPSPQALESIEKTLKAHRKYWKSITPLIYSPPSTECVSLQRMIHFLLNLYCLEICEVYWGQACLKELDLIPLPIADQVLRDTFGNLCHVSCNILEKPEYIVVIAHETYKYF